MAKKKSGPQPFGSRKGIAQPVLRAGRLSMKNDSTVWFKDITVMIDEAASMVTAAQIVPAYYREHGKKFPESSNVDLNDSMAVLSDVIRAHQEKVAALRNRLGELREKYPGTKLTEALTLAMMDIAMEVQQLMNDFGSVGLFAIDAALEPYRQLALTDNTVPAPAYMIPRKPDDKSFADLVEKKDQSKIEVIGLPGELDVTIDPTKPNEPAAVQEQPTEEQAKAQGE